MNRRPSWHPGDLYFLCARDSSLYRAAVQADAFGRFFVGADLTIYPAAVVGEQFVGRERAAFGFGEPGLCGVVDGIFRPSRMVFAAHQAVSHALLQLADITGPRIVGPEVGFDPVFNFPRKVLRFVAGDALERRIAPGCADLREHRPIVRGAAWS